jgi:predicted TPR repeat methyltransferase
MATLRQQVPDPTARALFVAGVRHLQAGRLDIAADGLGRALALVPAWDDALFRLGTVHLRRRDYVLAVRLLRRALLAGRRTAAGPLVEALIALGEKSASTWRSNEAKFCFLGAAALEPARAGTWQGLARVMLREQPMAPALGVLLRAATCAPDDTSSLVLMRRALSKAGRRGEATAVQRAIRDKQSLAACHDGGPGLGYTFLDDSMSSAPRFGGDGTVVSAPLVRSWRAEDYVRMGLRAMDDGNLPDAIACYRTAIGLSLGALSPGLCGAHTNLGNALLASKRLDEAIASFRQALPWEGNDGAVHCATALNGLGCAVQAKGDRDTAKGVFRQAVMFDPGYARPWQNLALLLATEDHGLPEAAAANLRAIALEPAWNQAHDELAANIVALTALNANDTARATAMAWLVRAPDHPGARHIGAAALGRSDGDRCSPAYLRYHFDSFAASFDQVLAGIGYDGPALLATALAGRLPVRGDGLAVADLGCGTGLLGLALRPLAHRLTGVDLSPAMLDHARARGLYDALDEADLVEWLADRPKAFDVLAAADVLIYFGALDALFARAAAALRPGGRLAFTAERLDDSALAGDEATARGWRLGLHGRYAHGETYVRAALAAAGLSVIHFAVARQRTEAGRPVAGFVVIAAMPD